MIDRKKVLSRFQSEEEKFLASDTDSFGIYQLKVSDELRHLYFAGMDRLRAGGDFPRKKNYEFIYYGKLDEGMSLEKIYEIFNIYRPGDFVGHSLSVSDIVVIHKDGTNTAYYVDTVGFVKLDWLSSWKDL